MNSLRVDEDVLVAIADGDPRALAIQQSWKFNHAVVEMDSKELDTLFERCRTAFHFPKAR